MTNINVSRSNGQQAEGVIAVDPNVPFRLFAASVDEEGALSVLDGKGGLFVSANEDFRFAQWMPRRIADGEDGLPAAQGDPVAAFDRFGNLFLAYLGVDRNNIVVLS